jgi:protein-S-isoprenylcysteine O-methyltransferase Ste14
VKNSKLREYLLVTIQVLTIAYIIISTQWSTVPLWCLIVLSGGGILAVWAILTMKLRYLRITPAPHEGGRLITHGPYRVIRHPMYTSLFIVAIPLIIVQFTYFRLFVLMILCIDLIIKLIYEERLLVKHFPEYAGYKQKSWRILPWIW